MGNIEGREQYNEKNNHKSCAIDVARNEKCQQSMRCINGIQLRDALLTAHTRCVVQTKLLLPFDAKYFCYLCMRVRVTATEHSFSLFSQRIRPFAFSQSTSIINIKCFRTLPNDNFCPHQNEMKRNENR